MPIKVKQNGSFGGAALRVRRAGSFTLPTVRVKVAGSFVVVAAPIGEVEGAYVLDYRFTESQT